MERSAFVNLTEIEIQQIKELIATTQEQPLLPWVVSIFPKLIQAQSEINQTKEISKIVKVIL